jgi:hypothetical protein
LRNPIEWLIFKIYYFIAFLRLWKSILYADVSDYRCKSRGTTFLNPWEAMQVAWIVYFT